LPWLYARMPEATQILLPEPQRPDAGESSETFFLGPLIRKGGHQFRERWVLRVEATDHRIYRDPSVERQYRVMRLLAQGGTVPVPRVFWFEPDRSVLGAPFFIMERVEGRVPSQFHHSTPFLAELSPASREALWLSAIETLARIHRSDAAPFSFLDRPQLGPTGLDQEIAEWDAYVLWSGAALHPVQERARQWLDAHMPAARPTGLAWGDARPGNLIFDQGGCRAVLDWETASLGGAETDLGWWLFYDWLITDGFGVARLDGLHGAAQFIRTWEQFAGRKAQAIEWHEVFATWRFSVIANRSWRLMRLANVQNESAERLQTLQAERLRELIGS
jgi:aminoglycoside phosphotransferase (APT) family kinase protein